ncbi:MAG: histidine kinase [Bacterioplanes sp.]|nr:histidine kinase [Bacterioplanes sp.]
MKKLSQAIALASVMTAGLTGVSAAQAEVSVAVDLANKYIFRGLDMGGAALVAGTVDYEHESGAYAGFWAASGDTAAGNEYNAYFGFGGEAGSFSYDINYLAYMYPADKTMSLDSWGEVTVGLGYDSFSFSASVPVTEDQEGIYVYYTLGAEFGAFGALVGFSDGDEKGSDYSDNYTHLDLSYAYNDNISFVLSKIVDQGSDTDLNDSTLFQVNYSLPINF